MLAPAKLTLGLRVTGRRADGFHLLDAEMVTVDLFDSLHFCPGEGLVVTDVSAPVAGHRGGPGLEGAGRVPLGQDNLVRRALQAVGRRARVFLEKRIPPGAGLGGGSADAGAVLRWAGLDHTQARQLATGLGADVPFCVNGGRARVRGVGQVVEQLPFEERSFVLAIPPIHVATAAVYQAWDRLGGPEGANGNDLEPAAVAIEPGLVPFRDALARAAGKEPRLAGSGAAWFVEGSLEDLGLSPGAAISVKGSRARLLAVRTVPALGA
jgi:4-diphosphocytidyl-2-C-methyl-D-erythritol kinase